MEELKTKITILLLIGVLRCNPNGDPNKGGIPRRFSDSKIGYIMPGCIHRNIRDELEEEEKGSILQLRTEDSLDYLAVKSKVYNDPDFQTAIESNDVALFKKILQEKYTDTRIFGLTFPEKSEDSDENEKKSSEKKAKKKSAKENRGDGRVDGFNITGPLHFDIAKTVLPINLIEAQIGRSYNMNEDGIVPESGTFNATTTVVEKGLYKTTASVASITAKKSGYKEDDNGRIINAIKNMYRERSSSMRPEGHMTVQALLVWKQDLKNGHLIPPEKLWKTVQIVHSDKEGCEDNFDDYRLIIDESLGIRPELEVIELPYEFVNLDHDV